ncbi:MAG: WYL domain-containing protein [Bacteroidetes bacterium]|nr:WYL domain-containing protein [Bacteroidota bacterium]
MSKRGYISRYLLILKKLKSKPYSTFNELQDYLENHFEQIQMQDDTLNVGFGLRTLQRDIKEIRNTFGIDIEYSRAGKGYFISNSDSENMNFQRMIDAFDMFNSLNLAQGVTPYIHLEKRRPEGTDNLYGLLHAIKNRYQVKFSYEKYYEGEVTKRTLNPYGLKEFRYRWYVLGKENGEGIVKTFALDRLKDLDVTQTKFAFPKDYNIEESFRHSFGIIGPNKPHPEEIILSFNAIQGKYIKSLALHHDQEILVNDKTELRIRLRLYVTHDLVIELLSLGSNMKVLKPKSLVKLIKEEHEKAYKQYL